MLQHKDFLLINTHAPYEVEIAGTDAHIPVDAGGAWLARYPSERTAKIVLYCRSGRWSTLTARELAAAGYRNIWHLDGGMVAWDAAGFPLQGH
jgi:rhodanese-related sulfurtransferase